MAAPPDAAGLRVTLVVRNLRVRAGGKALVELQGHTFEPGRVTAICGPNGAGKSTLLGSLARLVPEATGRILLDGRDLAGMSARERARKLAYLPQNPEIAWDVPVRTLVEFGRMPHRDSLGEPVEKAMAAVAVLHLAERRVLTLSGGERARVLLARALAGEPSFLLVDEPLAALDLAHRIAVMRHLRRIAAEGAGIVIVLHDLATAYNEADTVLVLDRGRLVAAGSPRTALSPERIEAVWGVSGDWVGPPGGRALIVSENV
jgi:iron complex transport system ATP-binding protein